MQVAQQVAALRRKEERTALAGVALLVVLYFAYKWLGIGPPVVAGVAIYAYLLVHMGEVRGRRKMLLDMQAELRKWEVHPR